MCIYNKLSQITFQQNSFRDFKIPCQNFNYERLKNEKNEKKNKKINDCISWHGFTFHEYINAKINWVHGSETTQRRPPIIRYGSCPSLGIHDNIKAEVLCLFI